MSTLDPVCALHGKRWSEHELGMCLYCCLCFIPLTLDECNVTKDGLREDVCVDCATRGVDVYPDGALAWPSNY